MSESAERRWEVSVREGDCGSPSFARAVVDALREYETPLDPAIVIATSASNHKEAKRLRRRFRGRWELRITCECGEYSHTRGARRAHLARVAVGALESAGFRIVKGIRA